jgi:hypothetical protein
LQQRLPCPAPVDFDKSFSSLYTTAHVQCGPDRLWLRQPRQRGEGLGARRHGKADIITTADPQAVLDAERVVLPGWAPLPIA